MSKKLREFEDWLQTGEVFRGVSASTLKRVVADLSEVQRECIKAYYFCGKKMPEIAKERGVAVSSVSRAIVRGKGKIAEALKYSVRR